MEAGGRKRRDFGGSAAPAAAWLATAGLLAASLPAAGCTEEVETSTIVASGHVEATEVTLSSKVGGTLVWFELQEGDQVTAGQELARTDTIDFELSLSAAEADRALADAVLRLRQAGFRDQEIAEASAQVARARADLDAANRDLRRFQALLDRGSGTEKSRDDALARVEVAGEGVSAAEARLELLRAGSRPEEIDEARARLAGVDARIAQTEQQIRDAVVSSPVSGVVTAKLAEQGELIGPGAPLAVITDLDNAWLTAYVGAEDLGRIRVGQTATVITDVGQTREGRLTFINPVAEFTPKNVQTRDERIKLVYRIKLALDNGDGLFKMGMPAEAHLEPAGGS